MDMFATHKMKSKDRLETLSAYYRVPVCMIMRANSITNTRQAFSREEMKIPKKCYCNRCFAEKASAKFFAYTVQQTDSVYSIAKQYGVTVNIILKTNHIEDISKINVGDTLRIPVIKGELYSVRPFESLEDIAKKYNISVDNIRQMNCLGSRENIYPGMQLIIG